MVRKMSISLYPETLAQLDYLRGVLGVAPSIKTSTLIQQVIFDDYMHHQVPAKKVSVHGSSGCVDDCSRCPDEPCCDYSRFVDPYVI